MAAGSGTCCVLSVSVGCKFVSVLSADPSMQRFAPVAEVGA